MAVYSNNLGDIVKQEKELPKIRGKANYNDVLCGRDFKYILFPKEYKKILAPSDFGLIAFSEFILHFKNLEIAIIDGEVKESVLKEVEKVKYPNALPIIKVIPKADINYRLVNMADYMANMLHREYSKHKKITDETLLKNLITPQIEHYIAVVSRIKRK